MENPASTVLTSSQKATIEKIKQFVRDKLDRNDPFICDHFILRFLTVRNWDVPKTLEMLTNYFPFRDRMLGMLDDYRTRKGGLTRLLRQGLRQLLPGLLPRDHVRVTLLMAHI